MRQADTRTPHLLCTMCVGLTVLAGCAGHCQNEQGEFKSGLVTFLKTRINLDPLEFAARQDHKVISYEAGIRLVFEFSGGKHNAAYVYQEGGLVILGRFPILRLADKDNLDSDLKRLSALIGASTILQPEDVRQALHERPDYFSGEGLTYKRLVFCPYTEKFPGTLSVPRCAVVEARVSRFGHQTNQFWFRGTRVVLFDGGTWKQSVPITDSAQYGQHPVTVGDYWSPMSASEAVVFEFITSPTTENIGYQGSGAEATIVRQLRPIIELWKRIAPPGAHRCDVCGRDFETAGDLRAHRGIEHEGAIPIPVPALKQAVEATDAKAVDGHLCLWMGSSHVQSRRPEQALPLLQRAVECLPRSAEAHARLSSALRATGQAEEAQKHADEAVQLDPQVSLEGALLPGEEYAYIPRDYVVALQRRCGDGAPADAAWQPILAELHTYLAGRPLLPGSDGAGGDPSHREGAPA